MLAYFDEHGFRSRVQSAIHSLREVLHEHQHPTFATAERAHTYEDKYGLCESLANLSTAAVLGSLENLGLTGDTLEALHSWAMAGRTERPPSARRRVPANAQA